MSFQPALDQINGQALRLGLNPMDGEVSWETAPDGRGVHVEFAFPDGTVLKGYAPNGMASIEAEAAERLRELTPVNELRH